jgi:hypothetical protein
MPISDFLSLSGLFGKRKQTLEKLSLDDLRRDQIKAENELDTLLKENEKIAIDESQYKEDYAVARKSGKDSLARVIAQKLQNLQMKKKGLENSLSRTSQIFQVTSGLILVKENFSFYEKYSVGSVITQMDVDKLENYILNATEDGQLNQEKLAIIIGGISSSLETTGVNSQSTGIDDFMDDLDAELLGETSPRETGIVSGNMIDERGKKIDELADKYINVAKQVQQTNQPHEEKER